VEVKINLEEGQTPEQAEEQLYKALRAQRIGDAHGSSDAFLDPAMEHVSDNMKEAYADHFGRMMSEIYIELDQEHENPLELEEPWSLQKKQSKESGT